ncbi:MAG: hypothetical protein KAT04_06440 [Methylococcales bacterium]|nr:hypothetical protein [Methylococcales bacterium]
MINTDNVITVPQATLIKESALSGYKEIPEPELLFADGKTDKHPLRGLLEYGPYSAGLGYLNNVKIAFMVAKGHGDKLSQIYKELKKPAKVSDTPQYYPEYPGFESVFRTPVSIADKDRCIIELPDLLDDYAQQGDYQNLAEALFSTIGKLKEHRSSFDVLFLFLPDEWDQCFVKEGFNLHDYLKAYCAPIGVPFQIIKDSSLKRKCRANVMWGLSLALYAKASGVPWKLNNLSSDVAYIGISYAVKTNKENNEYCTCCSQIFESDGTGFEFVAYDTKTQFVDRQKNPFLTTEAMQSVLTRSLQIYQRNNFGKTPKKIIIHKNTHFTQDEILGALDSFNDGTEIELVQIVERTPFVGIKYKNKQADIFPVTRGTYLPISDNEALLWTQGLVPRISLKNPNYGVYKDFALKKTPSPLLIRRFSGKGGWHDTCQGILGLTKMDWNNNTLHKKLPVTLGYSSRFAQIVKQNPNIIDEQYNFRYFM